MRERKKLAGFTHNINIIARCTKMQRSTQLSQFNLCGGQVPYLLKLCRRPGMTQEALAREMYVNKSTAARVIGRMEQAGLVERRPSAEDKRCVEIYPTQKALDALPAIHRTVREWNDYLLADLTNEERDTLMDLIGRVSSRAQCYSC